MLSVFSKATSDPHILFSSSIKAPKFLRFIWKFCKYVLTFGSVSKTDEVLNIDRFLHRCMKAQESIACRLTNSEDVYELQHHWAVKWGLVRAFNLSETRALSLAIIIIPNSFLNVRPILYCLTVQMRWVVARLAPSAREKNGSASWHSEALHIRLYQYS